MDNAAFWGLVRQGRNPYSGEPLKSVGGLHPWDGMLSDRPAEMARRIVSGLKYGHAIPKGKGVLSDMGLGRVFVDLAATRGQSLGDLLCHCDRGKLPKVARGLFNGPGLGAQMAAVDVLKPFASNDAYRCALRGVFFAGDSAVATDGRIAMAIPGAFPEMVGAIAVKDFATTDKVRVCKGEEIPAPFPLSWRSVIPKGFWDGSLDLDHVRAYRIARTAARVNGLFQVGPGFPFVIGLGGERRYAPALVAVGLAGLMASGAREIRYDAPADDMGGSLLIGDNGARVAIMPLRANHVKATWTVAEVDR